MKLTGIDAIADYLDWDDDSPRWPYLIDDGFISRDGDGLTATTEDLDAYKKTCRVVGFYDEDGNPIYGLHGLH